MIVSINQLIKWLLLVSVITFLMRLSACGWKLYYPVQTPDTSIHKALSIILSISYDEEMSELKDIVKLLDEVSPPLPLLGQHQGHHVPLYSLEAFKCLDTPFHMGVIQELIRNFQLMDVQCTYTLN